MSCYWSDSKFADKVRGTVRPQCGTEEEWQAWETLAMQKPVRYWLAENGLDYLQDMITSPIKLKDAIKAYVINRWKNKTHGLTSSLERGQYHDLDERIMYSVFDSLVHMIENELFLKNTDYWESKPRRFMRKNEQARLEAGINYLDWASKLTYGAEDSMEKSNPSYGQPTPQAIAFKEMALIYFWWKFERPNRPDPMVVTGLADIYKKYPGALIPKIPDNESEQFDIAFKNTYRLEEQYEQEDEDMLIRLMKIRRHLWV